MSEKTINICDGCGKELNRTQDIYKLGLQTDRFWNSVEMDYFYKNLDFCESCANRIMRSLEKITKSKEEMEGR